MNVTDVPAHTGFAVVVTETLTGRLGLTTIVMVFEVAGLLEIQTVSEEVRTHVTMSPVTGIYV